MAEFAKEGGDVCKLWARLRETDLEITEWRGCTNFAFAPTGPGVADYVQITLGREIEWRAGSIVNEHYPAWSVEELRRGTARPLFLVIIGWSGRSTAWPIGIPGSFTFAAFSTVAVGSSGRIERPDGQK
jgi:hypothetical protein